MDMYEKTLASMNGINARLDEEGADRRRFMALVTEFKERVEATNASNARADAIKAVEENKRRNHRNEELRQSVAPLFEIYGHQPPMPRADSATGTYRRTLARQLSTYLPDGSEMRRVPWGEVPLDALHVLFGQLTKEVEASSFRNDCVPRGEMVQRRRKDAAGREIVEWYGQESFVKDFARPARLAKIRDLSDFAHSRAFM